MKQIYGLGKIEKGKLTLKNKQIFQQELAALSGDVVVTVAEGRGKRSDGQNRWLWGVAYKILADHTGYTEEEIHEICKYKFNRKEFHLGDESYELGGSTRQMSTTEFMDYKTSIQQFGATLGCVIPDPNEDIERLK